MELSRKVTLYIITALIPVTAVISTGCGTASDTENVQIVAHRGAMADRPENTMAAFQHALELGADMIEIDLFTSSDGHLFVLHDATLDRTTDGEGVAVNHSLEELKQFDAGSWFDPAYTGQRIPSAREVMNWARDEGAVLLLDLKESGREYAENVANEVRSAGMESNVIVGVRSPELALEFVELLPESEILVFMRNPDLLEKFDDVEVDVIFFRLRFLEADPSLVKKVRDSGRKLMIMGTIGEPDEARSIMNYEPDGILINDVKQLQESLKEIK